MAEGKKEETTRGLKIQKKLQICDLTRSQRRKEISTRAQAEGLVLDWKRTITLLELGGT